MKMKTTNDQLREALRLVRLRELARLPSNKLVRRVDAKRGKAITQRMRKANSLSMLDMGQTKRHMPLPRFPDERTKLLFSAYEKRK